MSRRKVARIKDRKEVRYLVEVGFHASISIKVPSVGLPKR